MTSKLPIKWSAHIAYAVGLLATDGCLSPDKRHIVITSADKQLLEAFSFCIGRLLSIQLNPPSRLSKNPAFRIQFSDAQLYRWLELIGLTPNKSLTIGKLTIPDEYFRDFLRGHLDGDGSIIQYQDAYMVKSNPKYVYDRFFVYFISASWEHMEWLQSKIISLLGIHGLLNKVLSKTQLGTSSMCVLKFSTKEAKVLVNKIYYQPDLPCLLRKFYKAKPYLL